MTYEPLAIFWNHSVVHIKRETEDLNFIRSFSENFSEEYGYTHFYIVVSQVDDLPYYAIELQRVSGTKTIIQLILHQLFERLNIL